MVRARLRNASEDVMSCGTRLPKTMPNWPRNKNSERIKTGNCNRIAKRHEEAINGGDLAVIDEIVADDVIHHAVHNVPLARLQFAPKDDRGLRRCAVDAIEAGKRPK